MKRKYLIFILLICCCYHAALSQNEMSDLSDVCTKDTTIVKIERIEEYFIKDKPLRKNKQHIIVYIISGRYADPNHKNYNEVLQIVSLDTLLLQRDSKPLVKVSGHSYNSLIKENNTYLFHLELSGCFPIALGTLYPFDYYVFDNIRIPMSVCPLQPYKAIELKGLSYERKHSSADSPSVYGKTREPETDPSDIK